MTMSDHPLMPAQPLETAPFTVTVVPGKGPSFEAAASIFTEHPEAQRYLRGTHHRVLRFQELIADKVPDRSREHPPARYRATIYDYTNNRTVLVDGDPGDPASFHATESGLQPLPSEEEYDTAVKLLEADPKLGPEIRAGRLIPYRPMPPLLDVTRPDGSVERTIAVGLFSEQDTVKHQLAGVNMIHSSVLHNLSSLKLDRHIQETSGHRALFMKHPQISPPPPLPPEGGGDDPDGGGSGGSGSSGGGSSGGLQNAKITLSQNGITVWEFTVVRPLLSSGTNGSGVELRDVHFRGKPLLYRAHAPIVNVQYVNPPSTCGPAYRDWTNEECAFHAVGVDVVPGFRQCTSAPTTIFDTGIDGGNFKGVAFFNDGGTFVVRSMLQAGWYRYLSEWRFSSIGMIQPRFGFTAIDNPCTGHLHVHHAYWRFDFDVASVTPNVVEEYNNPPIIGNSNWHTRQFEIVRMRDAAHQRAWRVKNKATAQACALLPGSSDGDSNTTDSLAPGNIWVLRYHSGEIDDHQGFTTNPVQASIVKLGAYVNGESVNGQDVVVWYGADFSHTHAEHSGHIVGPTLLAQNFA